MTPDGVTSPPALTVDASVQAGIPFLAGGYPDLE